MTAGAQKKILIADDAEFFRLKIKDILVASGHSVIEAEDGVEALDELKPDPDSFDLLILDLDMPELDGFEVVNWIKNNGHLGKFPILVVSGSYTENEIESRLGNYGVKDILNKDAAPEEIRYRINKLIFPIDNFQRVSDRVPLEVATDFFKNGEAGLGIILNISATGLFLKTTVSLEEGAMLDFKFTLPMKTDKIELRGMVKRSTEKSGKENRFGGSGVMFTSVKTSDQQAIEEFVKMQGKKIQGGG